MARRFALLLIVVLGSVLAALLLVQRAGPEGPAPGASPVPRRTPVVPPTPIPARRVLLWFEGPEDGLLRAESRQVAAAVDPVGLARLLVLGILEGPRRPELLRPFPEGTTLRAVYILKDGTAVVDLGHAPSAEWAAGSHDELRAVQALLAALIRNLPEVTRVVILRDGEKAATLAGHVDVERPLRLDETILSSEPPLESPVPSPAPEAEPTPAPPVSPPPIPSATAGPSRPPARRPKAGTRLTT